jgi:hypothetical protein
VRAKHWSEVRGRGEFLFLPETGGRLLGRGTRLISESFCTGDGVRPPALRHCNAGQCADPRSWSPVRPSSVHFVNGCFLPDIPVSAPENPQRDRRLLTLLNAPRDGRCHDSSSALWSLSSWSKRTAQSAKLKRSLLTHPSAGPPTGRRSLVQPDARSPGGHPI